MISVINSGAGREPAEGVADEHGPVTSHVPTARSIAYNCAAALQPYCAVLRPTARYCAVLANLHASSIQQLNNNICDN